VYEMELKPMSDLKEKIETLAKRSAEADKPGDAMHLAQAALSLAQAYGSLEAVKK